MLARRVIVTLTLNGGSLYRTKQFRPDRLYTMNFVDMELADEVVLLDVTRGDGDGSGSFSGRVREFAENLFLPLAVGGWVRSVDTAVGLIRDFGADKVVVNTEAFHRPGFITELAEKLGSQSVVLSIDSKEGEVYVEQGTRSTGVSVADWAEAGVKRGAGEIYLMDVDRDGSLRGYNLDLLRSVTERVGVPVVISGGCGGWHHMDEGFNAGADACSTSVIHHFTRTSLNAAKTYLAEKGHEVRI